MKHYPLKYYTLTLICQLFVIIGIVKESVYFKLIGTLSLLTIIFIVVYLESKVYALTGGQA